MTFFVCLFNIYSLKSVLSDINIATPAFFFDYHLLEISFFIPSLCLCVPLKLPHQQRPLMFELEPSQGPLPTAALVSYIR